MITQLSNTFFNDRAFLQVYTKPQIQSPRGICAVPVFPNLIIQHSYNTLAPFLTTPK
jgi:hypothetical protein